MTHEIDRRGLLTAIGGATALVPAASGYWGLAAAVPPVASSRTAMTGATTLTDLARALADPPGEARNRLIGDHGKPAAERQSFVVPMLRKGQEWLPGAAGETPDPAGLLGPVRILTERTAML